MLWTVTSIFRGKHIVERLNDIMTYRAAFAVDININALFPWGIWLHQKYLACYH